MPARRLLPLLAFAVACVAQTIPAPANLLIEPVVGSAAVWIAPGDSAALRVKVTRPDESPAESVSVVFLVPAQGPTGSLVAADGSASSLLRAPTDAQGVAEVTLRAGASLGPFLVSAWIQGTSAAAHIAVSVVDPGAGAALASAAWTQALRDQLTIPSQAQIYGPFLLGQHSVVSTAGPPGPNNPARSLDRRTIFFWLDDHPLAGYSHPVRLIFLDAGLSNPRLDADGVVQRRDWWPVVQPSEDGPAAALVAPLFRIRRVGWAGRGQFRREESLAGLWLGANGPSALRSAGLPRFAEPAETCVVIIFGPDSTAFENSASEIRSVCTDTLNIPEANIIEDTVDGVFGTSRQASTPTRIRELLKQKLEGKNCKKLIFYYAGHGYNGGFCPANETDADKNTEMDFMPYSELADLLADTHIPEIDVILQACHTGSAIPELQGHGFSGTVATSAATDLLAYHNPIPGFRVSFWTSALTQTWRDLATIDGQDISLNTVAQATGEGRDPNSYAMVGDPRVASIEPNGATATAPTLVIVNLDDPAENPKPLIVTAPPGFPDGDGTAEIFIYDVSVANDKVNIEAGTPNEQIGRVRLSGGNRQASFDIQGLKPGATGYSLVFKDRDGKTYTGYGVIRVGAGYKIDPNPAVVSVGQSVSIRVSRGLELQASPESSKLTISPADSASAAVATPVVSEIQFPQGSAEQTFQIRGLQPGTATFNVSDGKTTKTLTVIVQSAACTVPPQLNADHTVKLDLAGHAPFLLISRVVYNLMTSGATVALTPSGNANLPPATGPLSLSTCSFVLQGRGTTAGFPNILTEYILSRDPATGRWLGTVEVGKGGGLPQNLSITYNVVAAVP